MGNMTLSNHIRQAEAAMGLFWYAVLAVGNRNVAMCKTCDAVKTLQWRWVWIKQPDWRELGGEGGASLIKQIGAHVRHHYSSTLHCPATTHTVLGLQSSCRLPPGAPCLGKRSSSSVQRGTSSS